MPRTLPTGMVAEFTKRGGALAPAVLVDIEVRDGTRYYWSDVGGSFQKKINSPGDTTYQPWLKSAGSFRRSRSLRTDAGNLVVQNISGNSIERDVWKALKATEFEGALCVVRIWNLLLAAAEDEFHGTLSEQQAPEHEASFKLLQLMNPSEYDVPLYVVSEQCPWRYKSAQCGSTGSAATCPKDFASCIDATRDAEERFGGVPAPGPAIVAPIGFNEEQFWGRRSGGSGRGLGSNGRMLMLE